MASGPKLNRDWIGLRVRTLRSMRSQLCSIPNGTEGTVRSYSPGRQGIGFEADPCGYCGIAAFISGLSRGDLKILTPREDWPDTRGRGR